MAITSQQRDQILKIVAGLFNGAPGGAYLSDFAAAVEAGMSMQDLARALAATNEFKHGIMGGKVTVEQQVAVLMNHFGVVADDVEGSAASLAEAYFTDSINAGVDFGDIVYTAVVFLENDTSEEFAPYKALLANKALVAALHAENTVNIASVAEGQSIFAGVTSDGPSTPEEAVDYLNGLIPGQTFTLTTGQDEIVGTVNKDIINGNDTTLTAFDSIDGGGASNDTLNLSFASDVTAIPVGVTVKNVENVNITAGGDVTADLSGWSGVHNLNVTGITAGKDIDITSAAAKQATLSGKNDVTFTDATVESVNVTAGNDATVTADAATSVSVTAGNDATVTADAATSVDVTAGNDVTITAAAATDISVSDAAGAGGVVITADVLENLALNNVAADTTITTSSTTLALHVDGTASKVTDADETVTDLAVVVNGDSDLDLDFAEATTLAVSGAAVLSMTNITGLGKLETLTVNGDAGLTADLSGLVALETIDGSATTGVIDVEIADTATSVKTGSGDDIITQQAVALSASQSISTGAGNDIVHLSDVPIAGATVDGGDGEDTLELENIADLSALDTTALEGVTNFEILGLSGDFGTEDDDDNSTLDLSALGSSFTGVRLNGTAQNAITLDNAGAATSLTILKTPDEDVTINLKTDGSSDSLALTIGDDTTNAGLLLAANTITAAGQDSLAVTANGQDSDVQHTLDLEAVDATSLTITGTAGVDFSGSTFTKLTTVTSDAEGDIKIALSTADDSTVTTGKGNDTIVTAATSTKAATINAGDGNNSVTTGKGDDSVTTGAGDDTITTGDGDNTINAGDGKNIVNAGAGNNTITTGAGDDDITVGNGNNTIDAGDGDNIIVAGDGDNTITTGAGDDDITVGNGNNTIDAGDGDDIITLGTGVNTVTTGAGADTVVVAVPLNGNSYSTVTDAQSGDKLEFGTLAAFTTAKVSLAPTAAFQDYLDAVVAANGADEGGWFQFGGDTFVVVDAGADNSTTFQNNQDIVIRLQGQVDLSDAMLAANVLTIG